VGVAGAVVDPQQTGLSIQSFDRTFDEFDLSGPPREPQCDEAAPPLRTAASRSCLTASSLRLALISTPGLEIPTSLLERKNSRIGL